MIIISRSEAFIVHEKEYTLESWNDETRGTLKWKKLISSDITPSDSMTAGTGELEPGEGQELAVHAHEQPEIYYILEGQGTLYLDGDHWDLEQGNAVFIPSNTFHGIRNTGTGLLRFFYVFPTDSYNNVRYTFDRGAGR